MASRPALRAVSSCTLVEPVLPGLVPRRRLRGSLLRSAPNGKVVNAAGLRALGVDLPRGAAPLSDQFLVGYYDSIGQTFKALDFYETVYSKAPLGDNFNIPLVRLTNDYKLVPGAATKWGQTSPTTWEFHIMPGIMWSDGHESDCE